jgi:hypothetical protein
MIGFLQKVSFIAAFTISVLLAGDASAADLSPVASPSCTLLMSGPIVEGDLEKVRTALADEGFFTGHPGREPEGEPKAAICLNSDGGSYSEGVAIAALVYDLGVSTVVDEGMRCFSACALIFMAGRVAGAEMDYTRRRLHIRGMLGFHAPYLVVPDHLYDAAAVARAYREANLAISDFLHIANKRGVFSPADPHIRTSLVEEFLAKDRDDMLLIDNVDKAGRWGISLFGYREPEITQESGFHACNNVLSWRIDQLASSSLMYA